MISSKQVLVNGGQFIQQHYHGQASMGSKAPIDILMEAVAPNALHNSGATFDKPKCHPRTRVKIREIIMRWILLGRDKDDQEGKQFMWLNGAAGCGKSAIAQSIIEACIEQCFLLASFFFNRSDATRNHVGSLVATLAYQLYCAFPGTEVQTEIISAIQKDPLIFKKALQDQFTSLIVQPLRTHFSKDQSAQLRIPFLIVIDGLDECTDRAAQRAILTCLAESLSNSHISIPIFVASRPEHDIKLTFSSKGLEEIHTPLSLDLHVGWHVTYSDIRLYLFDRFAEIKDSFDKRTTGRKLAQDWPGEEVIATLTLKSSRQFIYAATVVRYVESTRHRPDERLFNILNDRRENGDHPFAELDELYSTILKSALDIEKVLHVLSLYLMGGSPCCCSVAEKMLSYDEGTVEMLFCDLSALVQIDKNPDYEHFPSYLRNLHASFEEYLLDAARSKQFYIDMDSESVKHITNALEYSASCCSRSFNLDCYELSPLYYVLRSKHFDTDHRYIGQVTLPPELRRSVLSFPLKEFLDPQISSRVSHAFHVRKFVTSFMRLLQIIVLDDPTSFYIQDHQLGILQSTLLQQMQQCLNDDMLSLILVLFFNAGSYRFVPVINMGHGHSYKHLWTCTPFSPRVPYFEEVDIFYLDFICNEDHFSMTRGDDMYFRFVRQLLRDPNQPAESILGPIVHAKAALACFEELANKIRLLPSSSGKNIVVTTASYGIEDDTYPSLTCVGDSLDGLLGPWQFYYSKSRDEPDAEEMYFILLGYLIFLLPRSGRLDALAAHCEDHGRMSYIGQSVGLFPVRRRLLLKEISNYLARVLSTSYV
ncbi:hypothetical protein CPC08DRAFT_715631 [Agrocybe pediades]|nr:hypothetical protein CPC08DRAFT_715631 [Agrocybe pediades]